MLSRPDQCLPFGRFCANKNNVACIKYLGNYQLLDGQTYFVSAYLEAEEIGRGGNVRDEEIFHGFDQPLITSPCSTCSILILICDLLMT